MDAQTQPGELLDFFKSLVDAERLKIVGVLSNSNLTLNEIAEKLALKPGDVAKHMAHLEALGLVQREEAIYRLNATALEKKARAVLAQSRPKPDREAFEGDDYERKVLADYFSRDGSLKSIPSQLKKLMVILRYLVKQFQPDERYTEKQVNETLRKFHEDTASLRRYMVDHGLMARDKGIYWRVETPPETTP